MVVARWGSSWSAWGPWSSCSMLPLQVCHGQQGLLRLHLAPCQGTPTGLCVAKAGSKTVFTREYSKVTVELDCGTFKGTITPK